MSKKSRSKIWFLVHSWLALPIWFFVLIVCVTGTLAVLSQKIFWLANPSMRATQPADDAPLLSYQQVIEAIHKAEPQTLVHSISRPDESHFALDVEVSYPDGRSVVIYVNPYSGVIQGVAPEFNFRAFTRALHAWWLVPFTNGYSWGWYLVSFLGLPLLTSHRAGGLQTVLERFFPPDPTLSSRCADFLGRLSSLERHLVDRVHRGDFHHWHRVPDPGLAVR